MSKPTIVTLCLTCKRQYEEAGFTVKTYPGPSTTEKKTSCEQCHRRYGLGSLSQYVVTAKGGKTMNPVSKTYRPKERLCAYCGGIVICRDAANWGFKCRDYRPGPHYGHICIFCSWKCQRAFEAEFGPKKERLVLK